MSCQGLNSSKDGHFTTSLCNLETHYSKNALVVWLLGVSFALCWSGISCIFLFVPITSQPVTRHFREESGSVIFAHLCVPCQVLTHGYEFTSEAFCSPGWAVPAPSASPSMKGALVPSSSQWLFVGLVFHPSHPLSPTQLLGHCPASRSGREPKVKVRKPMGWSKGTLIGKAKAGHTSKAKQGSLSALPHGRQVFSHPWESRAPSHKCLLGKTNVITLNIPLLPSSLHFIYHVWSHMVFSDLNPGAFNSAHAHSADGYFL